MFVIVGRVSADDSLWSPIQDPDCETLEHFLPTAHLSERIALHMCVLFSVGNSHHYTLHTLVPHNTVIKSFYFSLMLLTININIASII